MARTEDGGRLSGAIDGDRWRFELEEEITSSDLLPPSSPSLLPSPFWSFNFGSYCHARSLARRRPFRCSASRDFGAAGAARRGPHNLPDLEQLHYTIRYALSRRAVLKWPLTHPFITAQI